MLDILRLTRLLDLAEAKPLRKRSNARFKLGPFSMMSYAVLSILFMHH